jgi:hypothetical protein
MITLAYLIDGMAEASANLCDDGHDACVMTAYLVNWCRMNTHRWGVA